MQQVETSGKQPLPLEHWIAYYRGIIERIAKGYDSPDSLAEMALDWVIHTDWCNSHKGEWAECDCAPAFTEIPPFADETSPLEPLCDHGIPVNSPSACPTCHSPENGKGDV